MALKCFTISGISLIACVSLAHAQNGASGTNIRDAFFAEGASTGTIVDFDDTFQTRFTSLASAPGVTFSSNISTSGSPVSGLPVTGTFFTTFPGTIVGTPFTTGSDDGRMGYQMVFDSPQQYAGIQRIWNSDTLTQFYDEEGLLLYEEAGSVFVGYTGDPLDQSTWVARIQIDTIAPNNSRQVGYSDDLIYGISSTFQIPEPSTWALMLTGGALVAFIARRKK